MVPGSLGKLRESGADTRMLQIRHLITLISAVTLGLAAAPAPFAIITCSNPASGTSWQITIDYQRGTVDANPASISDTLISWRDAKDGWNYSLDRGSGELTVVVASSTGGYFLHDQCRLPH